MWAMWTCPESVSAARPSARIIEAVWVATMIVCRLKPSATLPPNGASTRTGNWPAKPTIPRSSPEPVSR